MNPPRVSVNILTKNRAQLLKQALFSVLKQSFADFEIVVLNDGSVDETAEVLKDFRINNCKLLTHQQSQGITLSRQEALFSSQGEYVAILDDDDEWIDPDKLKKQTEFLDQHQDYVLVGGGIKISNIKYQISKMRPQTNRQIRKTMLFRNNFFTSTVMFRREAAIKAGGFVKDDCDFAEDYDLWLRMGKQGKMHNFPQVFASYRQPDYNKEKHQAFLKKQLRLIKLFRKDYPCYWLPKIVLQLRLHLNF